MPVWVSPFIDTGIAMYRSEPWSVTAVPILVVPSAVSAITRSISCWLPEMSKPDSVAGRYRAVPSMIATAASLRAGTRRATAL